jgi:hypothetical protein
MCPDIAAIASGNEVLRTQYHLLPSGAQGQAVFAGLPKAEIEKTLMNVQLFLVQARTRAAVPAGLKTACKFSEEAEPLT